MGNYTPNKTGKHQSRFKEVDSLIGQISNELVVKTILFSDQKPTGVWSSQVETDYLRKWSERPAPDWLTKMEELAIVRTHSPLPDSQRWMKDSMANLSYAGIRCVVFSTCSDLLASLPPPPRLPDDDVWQVSCLWESILTAKIHDFISRCW